MEILLSILFAPIRLFAFHPVACGAVAAALSVPVFLRNFSSGDRVFVGFVALVWWFFTWTEARISVQTNIRVDLLLLGPIYLALALIAGWRILRGGDEPMRARAQDSVDMVGSATAKNAPTVVVTSVEHSPVATDEGNVSRDAPEPANGAGLPTSVNRFLKWLRNPWLVSLVVVGVLPFVVSGLLQKGGDDARASIYEANQLRFEAAFRDDATVARFFGDVRPAEGSWSGYYVGNDQDDRFKHVIINRDGKT